MANKTERMGDPVRLGASIKEARERAGLTRGQLSVDPSYVFRIEKGENVPSRRLLLRIAERLGATKSIRDYWLREAGHPPLEGAADDESAGHDREGDVERPFAERAWQAVAASATWLAAGAAEEIELKLRGVVEHVVAYWNQRWKDDANAMSEIARLIADHGPDHNLQMVEVLCRNFKTEMKLLKDDELWLLLASIWLHDVGIAYLTDDANRGALGAEDKPSTADEAADGLIRHINGYERSSVRYLEEYQTRLGISDDELRIIENLCRHHRNRDHLRDVSIDDTAARVPSGRQKFMLALLRLVSTMEVRQERVVRPVANLLPFKNPIPADLESEIIRNLCLQRIYRDRDGNTLCGTFCYDRNFDPDMLAKVKQRLSGELQGALNLVSDVLALYKSVIQYTRIDAGPPPSPEVQDHLNHALNLLVSAQSPNAALVIDMLIGLLEKHLSRGPATLRDVSSEVQAELKQFKTIRGYHAQIANITEAIEEILTSTEGSGEDKINWMKEVLKDYKQRKDDAYERIREEAPKLLRHHRTFFLYGYSRAVLQALSELPFEAKRDCQVYVFECRAKADHGPHGIWIYCDGEEYALGVQKHHFKKVTIVADAAADSMLADVRHSGAPVVLLGAEGIEGGTQPGAVLSTIGTMQVVRAASSNRVPVYVFSESGKIRRGLESSSAQRINRWLFNAESMNRLADRKIDVRCPITELVPADMITRIVSDHGVMPPAELARKHGRPKSGDR